MARNGCEVLKKLLFSTNDNDDVVTDGAADSITLGDVNQFWQEKRQVFLVDDIDEKVENNNNNNSNEELKHENVYEHEYENGKENASNGGIELESSDRVLNKTSGQWIRICVENSSVIIGLFDRFSSDENFNKYKGLSIYSDPILESRINLLNEMRQFFVKKIATRVVEDSMNMTEARLFLVKTILPQILYKVVS